MIAWEDMMEQWESIGLLDIVTILCSLVLMVFVAASNGLFADFVASKPEGRKTALGE